MLNTDSKAASVPTVRRRVMAMLYEGFLLLSVEALAVVLYMLATGNRHGPVYEHGLNFVLFLVAAAYFVHFWTDSGHTLAMKTWRFKLVMPGYQRVPYRIAVIRYLLAWGWFLPALIVCAAFGWTRKAEGAATIALGVVAWALTAFLDKDRQFLHDKLAGTRLISLPKQAKKTAAATA
jgi:uncharacterized RDD family membrane protein YckC